MRTPTCSAVIATRNCLKNLPATLASAAAQRSVELEVIAVDDGSSDGTADWLAERSRDWPALRIVETGGLGEARARNAGIEAARAPLIAFLEAGDWWWPDKLAVQAAYHAAHPKTAFSFTDYLHVSADGENWGSCFEYWQPALLQRRKSGYFRLAEALQTLLATNLAGTSTAVASKAALEKAGGFRGLAAAGDWDIWLRLAAEAPVACSKAITATCLMRPESPAPEQQARIAAMGEIISPYEISPAASVRHAAAKARARLDLARAELARPPSRHASLAGFRARAFTASPVARFGKETTASLLNAALHFVSGHGAGK